MIWNRQIKTHQIEQRCHQSLALAQTTPEHTAQRQHGLDGQIGIAGLAAAAAWLVALVDWAPTVLQQLNDAYTLALAPSKHTKHDRVDREIHGKKRPQADL